MKSLLALPLALTVLAGSVESPWEALRHLPKHHVYTVLNHDGACFTGAFVSASDSDLILTVPERGDKRLARSGILRISAGETSDIHSTVYSARSSWADLQALQAPPYYSDLLVITADERQFKGSLLGISGDQLTLIVGRQEMKFAKEYVARVLLTSIKSTFEQSGLHRSLMVIPKKVIAPMQPVPLYEVTANEDNSRVECLSAYRRQ